MPDKISKLAAQLAQVQQQLKARAVAPQLGNSSLENKTLNQYTGDGTLGAQFGVLPDGTNGAGSFTGPNPPKPTQPSCSTIPGMIEARWNGKFVDALSPLDLRHVSVYVVPDGGTIDLSHAAGTVSGELGDAASIQMPIGTYQVYLVAWSLSGKWSAPSAPATVVVPASIDLDSVTEAIDDLNETTGGLLTTAAELGTRLGTAETSLTNHDTRIADAETDLTAAFGQISAAQGTATSAATAASTAQTAADTANAAAASAAGIANGKGKVLIQSTAPSAADRNAVTLWIDTTGSANTPKRWTTGTTWVAVTDKAATDAASAAAAAQVTATAAHTAAGTAQTTADGAMTIAGTKSKVYYSTAAPSGSGTGPGDLWRQRNGTQEIIGEWQWSGSAWVSQTVSGSIVSNMDIGFLTAGSAIMSTALINKLVAGTANFQTVDVKNLFVTTGTLTEAVINQLWVDVVLSRKITVQMLAVGSFDNMIPDPTLSDLSTSGWGSMAAPYAIAPTGGRGGGPALTIAGNAAQRGKYSQKIPAPDNTAAYRLGVWVNPSVNIPANAIGLYLKSNDSAGAQITTVNTQTTSPAMTAGTWTWVSSKKPQATAANTATISCGYYIQSNVPAGTTVTFSEPSCARALDGTLVVDGSITTVSLAADAINGMVITGATFQTSALPNTGLKFDSTGFRAYGPDGGDPIVEIRPDGATVLAVTDPATGDTLGGIGADGGISGTDLNIQNDPTIMGTPLLGGMVNFESPNQNQATGLLDLIPRGIVARGVNNVQGRGLPSQGGKMELGELSFNVQDDRMYQVMVEPIGIYVDPGAYGWFKITQTEDGSSPSWNSDYVRTWAQRSGTGITGANMLSYGGSIYHYVNTGTTRLRMHFSFECSAGATVYNASAGGTLRIMVFDVGPIPADVLVNRGYIQANDVPYVPPAPPAEKKNYTKTYSPTGFRNFKGDGSEYSVGSTAGKVYQGPSPASSMGNLSSIQTFGSMTGDLSGATITSIRVYFYFDHWYNNSGGTAGLMLHGQASLPSTKPSLTNFADSSGWPKPGGRWVNVPSSYWAGFKSGTYRGVGLGDGTSGTVRYGYANASKTRIEIKYTK